MGKALAQLGITRVSCCYSLLVTMVDYSERKIFNRNFQIIKNVTFHFSSGENRRNLTLELIEKGYNCARIKIDMLYLKN